ncbi:MAG: sigma-70 family RNA polymerase sigma factor, partial [Candidatus Rokubacteria bacterium]|nr:sigma-70 family RNA polymerase sigma factor [Candidatus Rokubacteria bacterium]
NTFLNRVKRQGREILEPDDGELERGGGGFSETMAPLPTPEEELVKHVVDGDLVRALEQLPLRFREVVLLADLEECSYKEIAGICGIPTGTVMSRLFRGRQLLRKAVAAAFRERTAAGRDA